MRDVLGWSASLELIGFKIKDLEYEEYYSLYTTCMVQGKQHVT